MHRASGKVSGGNMQGRWNEGVWLGRRLGTGEHIVAMADGKVYRTRAVKETSDKATFRKDLMMG